MVKNLTISFLICSTLGCIPVACGAQRAAEPTAEAARVANVINFIRKTEPRSKEYEDWAWITDSLLLATVECQIDLLNRYDIPSTFLIQYDALIEPGYQRLLKEGPKVETEIGAWWEITEPHCRDAGIAWRGRYPWDWYANVGFSTGYTPAEREKLIDTYFQRFKEIFGEYPKSVGSWFIDAHSLAYMHDRYNIEASTACRDQIGTDGYNLWGGYWHGAYYPSRKNFFIPAQTAENQIDVPTFRMLGSDPIRQYDSGLGGRHQDVFTLEPFYENAGGNPQWVDWFFDVIFRQPAMNLAYLQAGQENSFTWLRMQSGLEYQFPALARLAQRGEIRLEPLITTARAFRAAHPGTTPPNLISALNDIDEKKDRKTVWFNSKNYRINLQWEDGRMFVRDIHMFDENQESLYLKEPCTTEYCQYWTLPIVDGNIWSNDSVRGSLRFYLIRPDGKSEEMTFGAPIISGDGKTATVVIPIMNMEAELTVTLDEQKADFRLKAPDGSSRTDADLPRWYAALEHAPTASVPFSAVKANVVEATYKNFTYSMGIENATATPVEIVPPNAARALQAFTVTPDTDRFTLNFEKQEITAP